MLDQGRSNQWPRILGVVGVLAAYSALLHADDTELYIANGLSTGQGRPQVLIVFDNSGSMRWEEAEAAEKAGVLFPHDLFFFLLATPQWGCPY